VSAPSPAGPSELVRGHAQRTPDALALVDAATRLSWVELDRQATRAALALLSAGPRPGDRVALSLGTGADFVRLYLGALRAGLIAVPLNPSYTAREVEQIVADCGASLHLSTDSAAQLLAAAPDGADPRADRSGEASAVLLYTSGTSGRPRGAILSARALMANLDQLAAIEPTVLSADDVLFVPLPLSHVFGLNAGLGMALRVGATTVLTDRFDPVATLATMAAEQVTAVVGVPGQYAAWLNQPQLAESFASVRFAMSGSATLTRALVDGFGHLGVVLHDGYGLTEAAPVVAINAIGDAREHPVPGSVGRPIPGVEVQLRDGAAVVEEDGDPGRVFIRGANLFSGYWPLGDDGPDADGWFGTGDIAVQDAGGALHLVGRSTELVVVNGFNVYPAEVEAVLAAEPGVAEVAVVGVPSEESGEAVRAYVVPTAGTVLRPDELLAAAARSLARFKLPVIEVVPSLPHTVTGKVMKWALGLDGDDRGGG
jgi:long-chain acyl-CoA synthetase